MKNANKIALTLPTEEQLFGNKPFLSIKEHGTKASADDLAVWLGTLMASSNIAGDGGRAGCYWSASPNPSKHVRSVCHNGEKGLLESE